MKMNEEHMIIEKSISTKIEMIVDQICDFEDCEIDVERTKVLRKNFRDGMVFFEDEGFFQISNFDNKFIVVSMLLPRRIENVGVVNEIENVIDSMVMFEPDEEIEKIVNEIKFRFFI